MFEPGMNPSIGEMTSEQRQALLRFTDAKMAMMKGQLSVSGLRRIALSDPTPANIKAYEDLEFIVESCTAPDMIGALESLLKAAVDVDELRKIMPMLLAAVLQAVNVPLLLSAFNLNERQLRDITDQINKLLRSGME